MNGIYTEVAGIGGTTVCGGATRGWSIQREKPSETTREQLKCSTTNCYQVLKIQKGRCGQKKKNRRGYALSVNETRRAEFVRKHVKNIAAISVKLD